MNVPEEYKDIRPYEPEEIPQVIDELAQDEQFKQAMAKALPQMPFDMLIAKARQCKTLQDIHVTFDYAFIQNVIDKLCDGVDMDASSLDKTRNYTFISNHRDIILDSAFLCKLLLDNGFKKT